MLTRTLRTARYIRSWTFGNSRLVEGEVELQRDEAKVPATLLRPDVAGPLPAWVVLHGITRPGRAHTQLVRFTRAMASTGCVVLVPEVPEWRELELAPSLTLPTVRAAIRALQEGPHAVGGKIALMGFSFGAPQAITAAADAEIADAIEGVVGFGGYCDLERTLLFGFTGEHEWEGGRHHLLPDPYGRWIVGANYLTAIPEYRDLTAVAEALRRLAAAAGDQGIPAWDARFDADKTRLAADLPDARSREVFDLFAPRNGTTPDPEAAAAMVKGLTAAARRVDPEIQPGPRLGEVRRPVHLLHGERDHLIPFSEGLRLGAALPPGVLQKATVTPLFGHSSQDPFPGLLRGAREGVVFFNALRGIMGLV